MTRKEKSLLLIDLCSRLPYGVEIQIKDWTTLETELKLGHIQRLQNENIELKPLLRPMSSMTKKEFDEYDKLFNSSLDTWEHVDWLNSHHFDYRGLISMGLAIEVTEENNPYENNNLKTI